jgi:hypothetical protein
MVKLLGAIKNAAVHLGAGGLPAPQVIDTMLTSKSPLAARTRKSGPRNVEHWLRLEIAHRLSRLLAFSQLTPQVTWNPELGAWVLQLGMMSFVGSVTIAHSFLGALAQKLFQEVTDTRGWAFCSLCKVQYPVSRFPAEGRDNYCDTCRADGSMWRHQKQRQRAKRAAR